MAASPPRFNDDAARAVSPSRSNTRAASLAWRVASPYFPRPFSTPASPIKARARSADVGRHVSSARLYDSSAPFALPACSSLRASPSAASTSVWSDVIAERLQPASSRATQASSVFTRQRAVPGGRCAAAKTASKASPAKTCFISSERGFRRCLAQEIFLTLEHHLTWWVSYLAETVTFLKKRNIYGAQSGRLKSHSAHCSIGRK